MGDPLLSLERVSWSSAARDVRPSPLYFFLEIFCPSSFVTSYDDVIGINRCEVTDRDKNGPGNRQQTATTIGNRLPWAKQVATRQ